MQLTPITYTYQWFMISLSERLGSSEFSDFEPGQVPVPEDGVRAVDGKRVNGALGELQCALPWNSVSFTAYLLYWIAGRNAQLNRNQPASNQSELKHTVVGDAGAKAREET